MAGKFSIRQANLLLNYMLRGEAYTPPAGTWLALLKAADDTALRNNLIASAGEVAGGGYSRIQIRGSAALSFSSSTQASTSVNGLILWPSATAAWGTVTFAALMDAETGGNVIVYGALAAPKIIDTGDTAKIPSGLLSILM